MSSVSAVSAFENLISDIRKRQFASVYLLHGEEPYFIDAAAKALENGILTDAEKSFNQTLLYGRDTQVNDLIMAARRYPMGAPYQVIIVREAQMMNGFDKLEAYLNSPQPETILVLCYRGKKLDMRTKFGKSFTRKGFLVFESARLRDYQVKDWVDKWVRKQHRSLDPAATEMLVDYLGTDLIQLTNELEKLFLTVKDDFIQPRHIQDNIVISKEFSIFELQKALGTRNFNRTIHIAHHMANDTRSPVQASLANLYTFFSRIAVMHNSRGKKKEDLAADLGISNNPKALDFVLRELQEAANHFSLSDAEKAIGYLKYYDLRFKGMNKGNATDGQLFIELMVNLLKN